MRVITKGIAERLGGKPLKAWSAPRWFSNMSPCFISIVHFSCKSQLCETWSFNSLSSWTLEHFLLACYIIWFPAAAESKKSEQGTCILVYLFLKPPKNLGILYSAIDGCLFQVAITCNRLHWMYFTDWGYDKFNQFQIQSDYYWQQCCWQPT